MPETNYFTAVGRRKTATANVKLTPSDKTTVTVNGKAAEDYFPLKQMVTN